MSSLARRGLRVVERSGAGGEWPNGITVRGMTFKTVSPKPAFPLPEHLNAHRALTFLIAKKVIAVIAPSHVFAPPGLRLFETTPHICNDLADAAECLRR